jgi:hypothetical protein
MSEQADAVMRLWHLACAMDAEIFCKMRLCAAHPKYAELERSFAAGTLLQRLDGAILAVKPNVLPRTLPPREAVEELYRATADPAQALIALGWLAENDKLYSDFAVEVELARVEQARAAVERVMAEMQLAELEAEGLASAKALPEKMAAGCGS